RGELLKQEVQRAAAREPLVREPHDFSLFEIPEAGTCLSFHCLVAQGVTVEQAYTVGERLEQSLRMAIPRLGRVNIHLEPNAVPVEELTKKMASET
ncbi:MAG: cation transporter, partial [Desulfovibrio sp.]|nr:cation transporter [Desulfovibrio sp.]